ncbi:MAG: hypothetical protein L6R35_003764 [Caloplaca aegaea]|nr:MAG: hypothetical protein L6R35_003764 [Caloplaca aegaea]
MANPPASRSVAPGVTGIGMGYIHPDFLSRKSWPLHNEQRQIQYRKFVQLMINRIRAGESLSVETDLFASMFDDADHWPWMVPVLAMLPELDEHGPYPTNPQMNSLLAHVKKVIDLKRQRRIEKAQRQPGAPKAPESAKAVTGEIRARLAKLLFGPAGETNATDSMRRLLDSWVELGYPEEVIQQALDNKNIDGASKDLERDNLGLPGQLSKEHLLHLYRVEAQKRSASLGTESTDVHMPFTMSSDDTDDKSIMDNPPADLTSTDEVTPGSKETLQKEQTSFWHFQRMHGDNYDRYNNSISLARLIDDPDVTGRQVNLPSTEITPQGMTIMKGFLNQPPEKVEAMLKEIEKGASTAYEEAVMLQNYTKCLDKDGRETQVAQTDTSCLDKDGGETQSAQEKQLAQLNVPADNSFVVVTPRAYTASATTAVPTTSGLPDLPTPSRRPQVAMLETDENMRIDEVKKQLAALGMNVKGVNTAKPPQPMNPDLLNLLEKANRECSGPKAKEA